MNRMILYICCLLAIFTMAIDLAMKNDSDNYVGRWALISGSRDGGIALNVPQGEVMRIAHNDGAYLVTPIAGEVVVAHRERDQLMIGSGAVAYTYRINAATGHLLHAYRVNGHRYRYEFVRKG